MKYIYTANINYETRQIELNDFLSVETEKNITGIQFKIPEELNDYEISCLLALPSGRNYKRDLIPANGEALLNFDDSLTAESGRIALNIVAEQKDGDTVSERWNSRILYIKVKPSICLTGDSGGGVVPTGSITILENGTYDVTEKAEAIVEVPQPAGKITINQNGNDIDIADYATADVNIPLPSGSQTITENGVYDVTMKEEAVVAVPLPSGTKQINITENGVTTHDVNDYEDAEITVAVPLPSGSQTITENGHYDITMKETVDVEVPLPSGSMNITENGTYDVTMKEEAVVAVPLPSGSMNITENGTYDVTMKEEAVVAVPLPSGTKQISITRNGTFTHDVNDYEDAEITAAIPLDWFSIITGNYEKDVVIDGISADTIQIQNNFFQNKGIESVECIIQHPTTSQTMKNVRVGSYAFSGNEDLQDAIVPSFLRLGERCFSSCDLSGELDFSGVETIDQSAFYGVHATTLQFPACVTVESVGLGHAGSINRIEFGEAISTIADQAFWYDGSLTALVIRKTGGVPTLSGGRAFTGTPIASGTGYIYVPDALVNDYKQATNWNAVEAQIKGLSELPA